MTSPTTQQPTSDGPFIARLKVDPSYGDALAAEEANSILSEAIASPQLFGIDPAAPTLKSARNLLSGIIAGSPYLTGLIRRSPERCLEVMTSNPEDYFEQVTAGLAEQVATAANDQEVMAALRNYKSDVALLTALADIGRVWPVMKVTEYLTRCADAALSQAVRYLFGKAVDKGDWLTKTPETPELDSGYIVLGMGKYGAGELNYSSDIDLIIFYEREKAKLREGLEHQTFFVRLTRDLVKLIDERTSDGYVFRVDLRLRPDAGATQLAMSTDSALHYYESFGQNWERAALIKARAVCGDIPAGEGILQELEPFIWRRYLDFAAIADVHAMKRQVHAFKQLGEIGVAGHNVKLGRGGIREIEFFAQTQQLIAGGRQPGMRERETLKALRILEEMTWITESVRDELTDAYLFLREIEHRTQMVADEQTHCLPKDEDRLERFAKFAGYAGTKEFSETFLPVLRTVQSHYAALFEDQPSLEEPKAELVFAGTDYDPDTLDALLELGFSEPRKVIDFVRSWHHGRYPAVRSARSRERLTEVQFALIEALSDTSDPDAAIAAFDRFVSELPSGIQLFSLLRANPRLLSLVASIMGTAPRLARTLSRRRRLLDAVIDPRTFQTIPDAKELDCVIRTELSRTENFEDLLNQARVVGSEQLFLIGIRVLSGTIGASQAGEAYARISESLIDALHASVQNELAATHGQIPEGAACVLAMGKLGSREMTAGSDLDLIVIYDHKAGLVESDGRRPLAPAQYFARLTQRLIAALSAPTAEGSLYEVDMRLRPSGQQGPVATSLPSFRNYQAEEAWTWEQMALTRARVVSGPPEIAQKVEAAIKEALCRPRDATKTADDVHEMRTRIAKEKGTDKIWDIKNVRGGLIDVEFIAQYLQLINAETHPDVLQTNTIEALRKLHDLHLLSTAHADVLLPAAQLLHNLTQVLRICSEGPFDPETAPLGLRELLARAAGDPTFDVTAERLKATLADVSGVYADVFGVGG
ncbi:MAG: bifunctional [glutamine synthetase] adenylyltransferase/[glutamine synthetase]-adenylyl-L-tyrosine phosphorylase [Filomicrobium sp.]